MKTTRTFRMIFAEDSESLAYIHFEYFCEQRESDRYKAFQRGHRKDGSP